MQVVGAAAAEADRTGDIDPGVRSAIHDSGLAMAPFGSALGGVGLGEPEQQQTLCTILRMIGAADLSVGRIFEGHVNAVMLVCRYGSDHQAVSLAASVKNGDLCGVWGAEDAAGLKRVARGDAWLLEGRKILASGAGFVTRPLVTIATAEGHVLYLLKLEPGERADTASWRPLGMRASASGSVDLTEMHVGPLEQIGLPGDFVRQPFFSGGSWRFCAAQLGAMERLAELYGEQLRSRGRIGDPYQLERVAQCAAACGTALFWIEEACRRFADESLEPAAVVAFANLMRMVVERAALDLMENVQRGTGLPAFMNGNPVERIVRDLATYLRQPVPDLVMNDAARAVLAGELAIGRYR